VDFGKINVQVADGIILEFLFFSAGSGAGKRLMPWRWKRRCRAERESGGMVSCKA